MALRSVVFRSKSLLNNIRTYSGTSSNIGSATTEPPKSKIPEVTGLSSKIVKSTTTPVGPGALSTGEYKVPEYFCFNKISYYEAEIEMSQFRCPQPNNAN